MAIVNPTERPKSVRNRCVIEVFGRVFVLSRCFSNFSVGVRTFVIGLSQISSFFSFYVTLNDVSVIDVTAHRCAGVLKKKLELRSSSYVLFIFV